MLFQYSTIYEFIKIITYMSEKLGKFRKGIIRNRFNDLIKSKGRKSLAKKRFSKASLRKDSKDVIISVDDD